MPQISNKEQKKQKNYGNNLRNDNWSRQYTLTVSKGKKLQIVTYLLPKNEKDPTRKSPLIN